MSELIHGAAILLALLLVGCAPASPQTLISEGHAAIGSGDSRRAQCRFSEALKKLRPGEDQFIEASLGLIEALIKTDVERAQSEFMTLATTSPDRIGEKEIMFLAGYMLSANMEEAAIELVTSGFDRFGADSLVLKAMLARIKREHVPVYIMRAEPIHCTFQ
ncbi:MAG: hypothetical protein ABI054_12740 [Planctomycetota bacterium]